MGLAGLWASIKQRFSRRPTGEEGPGRGVARASERQNRRRPSGFLDPDTFAQALMDPPEGTPKAEDQRLHVFSLTDFKDAVGAKWDKLGGLLEVAGDAIIRRHVDLSKDVITRLDAEIACLSLPAANRQEAHAKVASIAADLSTYLFGDTLINGRRPQVVAANMAVKDAVTEEGTLDHEAIRRAVAQAGPALPPAESVLSAPHRATLAALLPPEQTTRLSAKPAKPATDGGGGKPSGAKSGTPQAGGTEGGKGGGPEAAARQPGKGYAISGGDRPYRIDESSMPQWVTEEPRKRASDQPLPTFRIEGGQMSGADTPARHSDWGDPGLQGADAARQTMRVEGSPLSGADAARQVMRLDGGQLSGADAARDVMRIQSPQLAGADATRAVMRIEGSGGKGADWLEEQLDRQAEAGLAAGPSLNADTSLTLVWTPTWVATKRAVGAFHAKVIRVDKEGAPPLEGAYAYADAAPIESLTMDRFVATQAAYELKDLFFGRHKAGITVPFHWMSLAPRWRDCIRIPFESCPPQARRKLLKIEIFGLSPAIPPHVVARLFDPLEGLGCTVMARLPLSAAGMVRAMRGVKAIGIDLAQLAPEEKGSDAELLDRMKRFRDTAHTAGMACYVWGIRRRPLISEVIKAGFSLVNGPGVMSDISHPRPMSGG